MSKSLQSHILKVRTQEHLSKYYLQYLQIYTDGSKIENGNCGAAFVIPSKNISKQKF